MKEERISDACGQAMLGLLHLRFPEELKCGSGHNIARMCTKKNCQLPALFCNYKDCEKCKTKEHNKCSRNPIEGVTDYLNEIAAKQKGFITQLSNIEEELISQLNEQREAVARKYRFGNL